MWYLISNNDGIVETSETYREMRLNHSGRFERELISLNRPVYHVYDDGYDYYLFSSKEQAIENGFYWAFE